MTLTKKFTGKVHPVAALFPMLTEEELVELAEDIGARGQLQPCVVDAKGVLLDGRNRIAACDKAGVEPQFVLYDGDDPGGYALSVNITRRHLSKGQQAMIAARADLVSKSGQQLARVLGMSEARISQAKVVLDFAPDLADGVVAGTVSLDVAVGTARERKTEAAATEAAMVRLRESAPDMADLVTEERMTLPDAIAVLDARVTEEQREAEERKADREGAIRRAQDRLHRLVDGWIELPGLSGHPDRQDVLAGLNEHDREQVLMIEAVYEKGNVP